MQLNPAEISELIKGRIEGLKVSADIRNQGTVVSVADGIVRIHGLSDAMQGEMLEFPPTAEGVATYGLALNLERDSVGSVILGEYEHIAEGDTVKCTGRILEVPVGPELIGRVVNALGHPIDGKGPINAKMTDVIEKVAPGVIARQSVNQPMQTGLKSIDSMVPIGRGQRELIIGDRQTGKTAVAVDTIINQKGQAQTTQMRLGRSARPVVLDILEAVQGRGEHIVEVVQVGCAQQGFSVKQTWELAQLGHGTRLHRTQEEPGVDLSIEAPSDGMTACGQIQWRADCRDGGNRRIRRLPGFLGPAQQGVAAERDANGQHVSTATLSPLVGQAPQDPVDLLMVPRVVGARRKIDFSATAAEMRHDKGHSQRTRAMAEGLGVMAARGAFKAMEQNQQGPFRRRWRQPVRRQRLAKIQVDEIAVRGVPALAPVLR